MIKVKLVRDKYIPTDETFVIRKLGVYDDNAPLDERLMRHALHMQLLRTKIVEEVQEICETPWNIEEYADVLQIFYDLIELSGITLTQVEVARTNKKEERGGFLQGVVAATANPEYTKGVYSENGGYKNA